MRTIGAALLVLAGLILGMEKLLPVKRRLDTLEELCCLLERLHGELRSRPAAVGELCREIARDHEGEAGAFFQLVSCRMDRLETESFDQIWKSCLQETMPGLGREEGRELEKLGSILGRYELAEQLSALQRVQEQLREILHSLKENYPTCRKLYLGVPCSISAMLALVLI